ncbi:hypothetical protein [Allokutzneria sp. NRRL B-24872]|uniref:terpene synthase family protein n=1 Tax=Allokutzneria sp. NRRL B-24872 TaxID=1137961 RepID=UPI001177BCAE|nr:hypothetical protein [Allokutzneria sp. NRRL B-24872]
MSDAVHRPAPALGVELALSLPKTLFGAALVHPRAAWVRARYDEWVGRPGASSRAAVDQCLHILPHAPAERVLDVALLLSLFGGLDDLLEANPHTELATYFSSLRTGHASTDGHPELDVLTRGMQHAQRALGPRLFAQLLSGVEQWANSMAPTASGWADLDTYLQLRRADFGFDAIRVMVDHAAGIDLDEHRTSPLLDELLAACFEHALFVNDLFSYRKETQAGDGRNAVSVLLSTAGMTPQAAVDVVCERITAAERTFADLGAHADIAQYATFWRHVLAGNLAWSMTTPRYNGVQRPAASSLPTHMVLHPDHTEYRYRQGNGCR